MGRSTEPARGNRINLKGLIPPSTNYRRGLVTHIKPRVAALKFAARTGQPVVSAILIHRK